MRSIKKNIYRISLRILTDIGLVNQPVKIDTKGICTLKTDLRKLFKSDPDAKII